MKTSTNFRTLKSQWLACAFAGLLAVPAWSASMTDQLVVHLPFNNSLQDASGRNNHATALGAAPLFEADARVGSHAVRLDVGQPLTLGSRPDLQFGADTDFTITLWFKAFDELSWTSDPVIVGNKDWGNGSNPGFLLAGQSDGSWKWNWRGQDTPRRDLNAIGQIRDGAWHHLAVTHDRQGLASVYQNGQLIASTTIAGDGSIDALNLNIGQDGTGNYNREFDIVFLDDLGIWRRALSDAEIESIYQTGLNGQSLAEAPVPAPRPLILDVVPADGASRYPAQEGLSFTAVPQAEGATLPASGIRLFLNDVEVTQQLEITGDDQSREAFYGQLTAGEFYTARIQVTDSAGNTRQQTLRFDTLSLTPTPTEGLVLYLPFDNSFADQSGRDNHGTGQSGTLTPTPPGFVATGEQRIGSHALKLENGQYVNLGQPDDLKFGALTDFSIGFWARAGQWTSDPSFISNKDWNSGGNQGWIIAAQSGNAWKWNFTGSDAGRKDTSAIGNLLGEWRHILVTHDRDGMALFYYDGELVDSINIAGDGNVDTAFDINIGQDGTGNYGPIFIELYLDDLAIWRRVVSANEAASIYAAGLQGIPLTDAPILPEIIDIVPDDRERFHPAASGIRFTARTTVEGVTIPVEGIRLQLNGTDVSSALSLTGTPEERSAVYSGLQSSMSYLATITVTDSAGHTRVITREFETSARVELKEGLVVHLTFDNHLQDSSGRNNHAQGVASPGFATEGDQFLGSGALHIQGGGEYVTLGYPDDLLFGSDVDFTVAFWVRGRAWTSDPSLMSNKDWNSGSNPGWIISSQSGGTWKWNWKGSEVPRRDVNGISDIRDNAWHHVAVSHDRRGLARFFVNGEQLRTISIDGDGDVDTDFLGYAVNIGQDGTGNYGPTFQDILFDDVGIWRRALDEQDVSQIYAAGLQGLDLSRVDEVVTELVIGSVARDGDNLVISWDGGPGIRLQTTPNLTAPEWTNVEGTEGSSSFTGSIDAASAYYRLSR